MTTLVLAATGRLGPSVVAALLAAGEPVTAVARDKAKAAAALPGEAELAIGDLGDREWLNHRLDEADSLVLLTPHGPEMAQTQMAILGDAARRDVRVVKVSGTGSLIAPDGPDACRQHWLVEQEMARLGQPHVIVRPNAFMQGLVAGVLMEARSTGAVSDPIAGAGINAIDCRDIGEVIARCVADQDLDGRTLVLTGPRSVSYLELTHIIDEAGVPATVRASSPSEVSARMRSRGLSEWEADHLREMLTRFGDGAADFATTTVHDVLGREPGSVETFIQELTSSSLVT
ncbi:NAD(P)H-binding protein [Nocardioides sp. NPDC006273]|uniref:NmrA family NAD(P)-binding protein n=1 Tax=Nocardioides sp. NPDC006273 TaxID=3155598 RepID=UPI0033B3649E